MLTEVLHPLGLRGVLEEDRELAIAMRPRLLREEHVLGIGESFALHRRLEILLDIGGAFLRLLAVSYGGGDEGRGSKRA